MSEKNAINFGLSFAIDVRELFMAHLAAETTGSASIVPAG